MNTEEINLTANELKQFNSLYTKNYSRVLNFVNFQLNNNLEDAEDITQLAFIKAAKNFSSYDSSKSKMSTWLYSIAKNSMIDHIRANKNRKNNTFTQYENKDSENKDSENKKSDYDNIFIASKTLEADSEIQNNELLDSLINTFEKLSPKYREIATLYFINEYSHNEIVEMLNLPLNTVKVSIFRCREQMQKTLNGIYKEFAIA